MARAGRKSLSPNFEYQKKTLFQRFLGDLSWDMALNKEPYGDQFIKSVTDSHKETEKQINRLVALNTVISFAMLFYSIGITPAISFTNLKIEVFQGLIELMLVMSSGIAFAAAMTVTKLWSLQHIIEAYCDQQSTGKPFKANYADIQFLPFKATNHIVFPKEPRFYVAIKKNPENRAYYGVAAVVALVIVTHVCFYYACQGAGLYFIYYLSDTHPFFRFVAIALSVVQNLAAVLILYVIFVKKVTYVGLKTEAMLRAVKEVQSAPPPAPPSTSSSEST